MTLVVIAPVLSVSQRSPRLSFVVLEGRGRAALSPPFPGVVDQSSLWLSAFLSIGRK
jgi:hypothetical protein